LSNSSADEARSRRVRVEMLLRQANVEMHRQNYKAVVKLCDEALELDPNSPDIYEMLGDALAADGRYTKAMEAYRYGLRLDPSRTLLEDKLARASLRQYEVQRKLERARKIIESGAAHEKSLRKAGQLAAVLSFIAPGLGQIRNGQHFKGLAILMSWLLLVVLVVTILTQAVNQTWKEMREDYALRRATRTRLDVWAAALAHVHRSAFSAIVFWSAVTCALGLHAYAMIDASIVATKREEEDFL